MFKNRSQLFCVVNNGVEAKSPTRAIISDAVKMTYFESENVSLSA